MAGHQKKKENPKLVCIWMLPICIGIFCFISSSLSVFFVSFNFNINIISIITAMLFPYFCILILKSELKGDILVFSHLILTVTCGKSGKRDTRIRWKKTFRQDSSICVFFHLRYFQLIFPETLITF